MNESEWLHEWKTNERTYVGTYERTNARTHERMNERLNWRMVGLMSEWLRDWWTKRPKLYCINYALNSGSYSKIAETLLPMTIRKGSGKVWEEHDKILGGGGGVWNFWRLPSHPTLKMTWSSTVPVNQGLDDTLNISPEEVTNFYLFWSLSKVVDHTNDWFSLDWIINAMEIWT